MNAIKANASERDDVEALLPWHAAGTLDDKSAQRVEHALAKDAELRRRFALVREEFGETIRLNEALGAPSARALERLMAGIEQEGGRAKVAAPRRSFRAWLAEKLSPSPRALAFASAAAAVIIIAQAGLIGRMYYSADESDIGGYRSIEIGPFGTASKDSQRNLAIGTFVFIGFVPSATAGDITHFLDANKLVMVDGPRAGQLYKVRVSSTAMSKDQVDALTSRLKENRAVVSMVLPETTSR
jgi:hypothetical protein